MADAHVATAPQHADGLYFDLRGDFDARSFTGRQGAIDYFQSAMQGRALPLNLCRASTEVLIFVACSDLPMKPGATQASID